MAVKMFPPFLIKNGVWHWVRAPLPHTWLFDGSWPFAGVLPLQCSPVSLPPSEPPRDGRRLFLVFRDFLTRYPAATPNVAPTDTPAAASHPTAACRSPTSPATT